MTILVVDDDASLATAIRKTLSAHGYSVVVAGCVAAAREAVSGGDITLLISDVIMPGVGGAALIADIRSRLGDAFPIIAISGGGPDLTSADGLNLATVAGAQTVLFKPFEAHELIDAVETLIGAP